MAMSPWMPETSPLILRRVGKTGEEAAELLKVTNRIVIQGIDGVDPETGVRNVDALRDEIADVMAQCEVTIATLGLDRKYIERRAIRKMDQMAEWEALVGDKS